MQIYEIGEVVGLAALLAGALFQLHYVSILSEWAYQVRLKRINDKLDLLWEYLGKHTAAQFDKSVFAAGQPEYTDVLARWYKADEQPIEKQPLLEQLGHRETIREWLLIIGSVLLVGSKIYEYIVT